MPVRVFLSISLVFYLFNVVFQNIDILLRQKRKRIFCLKMKKKTTQKSPLTNPISNLAFSVQLQYHD